MKIRNRRKWKPRAQDPKPYKASDTPNGRTIQKLLIAVGKNPATFKNWIVASTGSAIDWISRYAIVDGQNINGSMLIHKSKLHRLFPRIFADTLWNRSIGQRVHQRNPNPRPIL